jgi:hypothetical protein
MLRKILLSAFASILVFITELYMMFEAPCTAEAAECVVCMVEEIRAQLAKIKKRDVLSHYHFLMCVEPFWLT